MNGTTPPSSMVSSATSHVTIDGRVIFTRTLRPVEDPVTDDAWLVFLHEGLGCTAMWHDFPETVVNATRMPALIYDRQGYGRSGPRREPPGVDYLHVEAEKVLPALIDHFGIRKPVLIGHSDGGTIALLYAARFPQRVLGVISEAAHVFVESVTLEGIRATVEAFKRGALEDQLSRYHGAATREMFFHWADVWLSDAFRNWNIEACLPHTRCEVLVIQGLDDPYGTVRQVEAITSGIGPRARQCLIPSCGHTPHREAPRRTLTAMHHFIREGHGPLDPMTTVRIDSC